jgi:hypothetical protein
LAATTGWPSTAAVPFYVVIDPGTSAEEKCSATISGSTLTLVRAQDDTSASSHSSGASIYPVFTANDADEANEVVSKLTTKGDLLVTSGSALNRLAVGTNDFALLADSSTTNGVAWKQIPAAGIASDAVTTEKILDLNVTGAKLANLTVSTEVASYVLVAADRNTRIVMDSASATTITVNTSLFAAGDTLFIQNIGVGTCTITAGTATVTSSGSLALGTWAGGTLYFTSASAAIFFPSGGLKTLSVEYLAIGGGGGGGGGEANVLGDGGGGGGAGGYRSSVAGESTGGGGVLEPAMTLIPGTYTVTVGAGGAGGGVGTGGQGSNSTFNYVVALGGALGRVESTQNGASGGSGGGSGGTAGIGGRGAFLTQGYNGGAAGSRRGGGGGGASGDGAAGTVAPAGGAGLSSSITGSAVSRGGGGGGGGGDNLLGGAGGTGGGGAGGNAVNTAAADGTAGTVNTGGGGGAGGARTTGGGGTGAAGGSGVVILRYLTSSASNFTITGGTITTSGSYTIHSFTSTADLVVV